MEGFGVEPAHVDQQSRDSVERLVRAQWSPDTHFS